MSEVVFELPGGDADTGPPPELAVGEIDHAEAAVKRLVLQFQKPRFRALVRRLVNPMQALEHAAVQLLIYRNVENAFGALLDQFGKLVGQPRRGQDDDTYRLYIRARIKANRSRGTGPDILAIARLVVNNPLAHFKLVNHGFAAFTLQVTGINTPLATAEALLTFLRRAVAAGVRFILVTQNIPDEEAFTLAPFSGPPEDGPGLGLGSTLDAGVGGKLVSANE